MRNSKKKFNKKRAGEIFDSGVTTVNGYLIQGLRRTDYNDNCGVGDRF